MYKYLLPLVAVAGLSACDVYDIDLGLDDNDAVVVAPAFVAPQEPVFVAFSSLKRLENGDVTLTADNAEITIPAAQYSEFRGVVVGNGNLGLVSVDGVSGVVANFASKDVEVAGVAIYDSLNLEAPVSTITGIDGTFVAAPTSGSTSYQGGWLLASVSPEGGPSADAGELTLNHDFVDNTIAGSSMGVFGTLEIDAVASANGTISGMVSYDALPGNDVGELEGGFFGEDAAEIAGTFQGDDYAGAFHTTRDAEIRVAE